MPTEKERDPGPETKPSAPEETRPVPAAERDAMDRFLDLPIDISVQLDRKRFKMYEVLNLRVDSVIKLERSAGENVDLLFDGVVVGNGEIVVIEDMMGLRVTDLHFRSQDGK